MVLTSRLPVPLVLTRQGDSEPKYSFNWKHNRRVWHKAKRKYYV